MLRRRLLEGRLCCLAALQHRAYDKRVSLRSRKTREAVVRPSKATNST
jgi:hypothetical protein